MFKTADLPKSSLHFFYDALRRNRLLLSIISLQVVCAIFISLRFGLTYWGASTPIMLNLAVDLFWFMLLSFVLWRFGVVLFVVRPKKPIHWMLNDFRSILTDREKVPDAIICFASIVVHIVTYSFLKDKIQMLNPVLWDAHFMYMDRVIHGGTDPWKFLAPVLGSSYATWVVNFAYHLWFPVVYGAICIACLDRSNPARSTVFLVAFALSWFIGGNVLAIAFSSVGPVYYEHFGFGDTYAPQMAMLREINEIVPIWALDVQDKLLNAYQNIDGARGISAMPSMHVASSAVLALYGFSYSRWLGWILTAFTAVIFLGSVHLAWHYAIDGYASVLMVMIFWWVAKKLTARYGPNT